MFLEDSLFFLSGVKWTGFLFTIRAWTPNQIKHVIL